MIEAGSDLCYSVRLVRPFWAVLRETGSIPAEALAELEALDLDARLPIPVVHDMLHIAQSATGDPDLGLKAARRLTLGDVGAADYFWSTSATVRDALMAASRSARLVNDALDMTLDEDGALAHLRLKSRVPVPRAGADFMVAGIFWQCLRAWLAPALSRIAVSFAHEEPASLEEYRRTFSPARVAFSQDFVGYTLDKQLLDSSLPRTDPKLHEVLSRGIERLLAEMPAADTFTDKVRRLIVREMADGNPSSLNIARELNLGERTLARQLEREGASFKALRDEARRELALRLVSDGSTDFTEITRVLGFSQTAAFHRAFRRWTGSTPRQHRIQKARSTLG